jgi:hypothetical protein
MATYDELTLLLIAALETTEGRWGLAKEFVRRFNYEPLGEDPQINELLDLVMTDLADYEPRPEFRRENDDYYDDEQIEGVIRRHLEELGRLGVEAALRYADGSRWKATTQDGKDG